jgi:hypothetical protein
MEWVDLARRYVPRRVRFALQRLVSLSDVKRRYDRRMEPLADVLTSDVDGGRSPIRFGIVANRMQAHARFVRACLELEVPFTVIDLLASDWWQRVQDAACDALLAWPDASSPSAASLLKDRLDLLELRRNVTIFPAAHERWMYEDKLRMADWLVAHDVPHPRTWVFAERDEAEAFATSCHLPVVTKTAFGAQATGVQVLRTRGAVRATVARAFGMGLVANGHDHRERQRGRVLFQEHLDVVHEWRLVRIGDAYFGHPKGLAGEFHSGSGRVLWDVPEPRHLDFLHAVTELGRFRSMDVDTFETRDGRLLVNELQTVFGASASVDQMRVDGVAGRMVRRSDGWHFEAGDFARNACANARVLDVIDRWPS